MRRHIAAVAMIAACVLVTTSAGAAPADDIKYRKSVMSAMAAHFGALSLINFGRVPHKEHLQVHARALADLGAQMGALFPAGSEAGKTDALPLIWKEREPFDKRVADASRALAELRDAAAGSDKAAMAKAFKAAGETCKGCHDRYRKEQK
jgi:cytochrome c556